MGSQNVSQNQFKNYVQLIHAIGASVLVNAILIVFYTLVSPINEINKNLLLLQFVLFIPFCYTVYFSKHKIKPTVQLLPYIIVPIVMLSVTITVPPFAPYITGLFFLLNTAFVLQFGTKNLTKYIAYMSIIYLLYAMVTHNKDVSTQIILAIWLIGVTISIAMRDTVVRKELTSSKTESIELTKANNQLKDQSEKLETILDNIQDAVIVIDNQKAIIKINKVASIMLGYTSKELQSKKIEEIISQQNFSNWKSLQSSNATVNQDEQEDIWFKGKDGSEIPTNMRIVQDRADSKIKILLLKDRTKEFELEKMKLDFVALAAHELRTPITSINGYLNFLLEECANQLDENGKTYLKRAIVSTEELENIMETILAASNIEKSAGQSIVEDVQIEEVIAKILYDFNLAASEKKIDLQFDRPLNQLPAVSVDPRKLYDVLSNLIGNAIKYTQIGKVTIRCEFNKSNESVTTYIQDTGPGIPIDSIPKLFNKFYRVGGELERGSKGTGLGLYITKKLIEQMQGTIKVKSVLGAGSTFYFSIPIKAKL